jgi:LPS-assembly lipoprotein
LHYRVSLRAYDNQQNEWLPAENLMQSRDFTYDDTQLLAKATEEEQLYQNMRVEMAQQIMRRLSHAKPEKALQK